ncbi:MAG: hybrid sensor histidine kinase/response regulator [Candidatus Delongbacteria bacterium]|nr:hybrid sensor histidine kinase/response regulator [Candidatus Delongbacteria bacterium]
MYKISMENAGDKRAKILIVDDDPLIVQSLEMVLERYFEVYKVSDPLLVFDILKKENIDVLISDEMMPGMRGSELSEKVNREYPKICKIILSGNSDKKDIVRAINEGHVFSFLFKPVDINQLLQAVKRGLDHKRLKETIELQNIQLAEKNKNLIHDVLKKSTKILEMEKFYELGKFSASIVHDLNSPLQTLITGYQLLEDEIGKCSEHNSSTSTVLSLIDKSLSTMEEMIKSISNRINDKISEKSVRFDLNELIRKNIEHLNLTHQKIYPFEISFLPSEDIPLIKGVPLHFDQILTNILKNSFDALEHSEEKKITVKTFIKSEKICIFVKDTGTGIPAEDIEKIFDIGFSTKDYGKGTGLGLVITRQMVESYKGRIKVESEPGAGTSLLICFPVRK